MTLKAVPTTDFMQACDDLARVGVAILAGVLTPAETAAARRSLFTAIDASAEDGIPARGFAFDPDDHNIRVWHLINFDPVFVELARHPQALAFVRHLIGDSFLISNISANITQPGNQRMRMHADQGYVPPPWQHSVACVVGWLLDDMTAENGGTCYVPGSHLRGHNPDSTQPWETVAVEAPAGSLLAMDGRTWHQTGANTTANSERAAILPYYVQRWLRPQVNWNASLWPETVARLEPEFLHMLGYYTGNSEFQIPSGRRAQARAPQSLQTHDSRFILRAD
jgi:fumagillin biosynthesis dioxygenase